MAQLKRACLPLLVLGLLHSGVAACTQRDQTTASDTTASAETIVSETENSSARPKNTDEQMQFAKEDLARRLSIETGKVELQTVRHVHWRSGAIGCPKPGMSYSMAIVPGVLVVLEVDGETYRYHAKRDSKPFYCPADRAESPALGQGEEAF